MTGVIDRDDVPNGADLIETIDRFLWEKA